ncbi:MAG: hypothetical protein ACFCUX_07195 [Candidatus Methylacidiphilales bacterium]
MNQILGLIVLVYLGVYLFLTLNGEYAVGSSGNVKVPLLEVGVPDRREWQPQDTRLKFYKDSEGNWTASGNTPGYIFAPLILIDRLVWHRHKGLLTD